MEDPKQPQLDRVGSIDQKVAAAEDVSNHFDHRNKMQPTRLEFAFRAPMNLQKTLRFSKIYKRSLLGKILGLMRSSKKISAHFSSLDSLIL